MFLRLQHCSYKALQTLYCIARFIDEEKKFKIKKKKKEMDLAKIFKDHFENVGESLHT